MADLITGVSSRPTCWRSTPQWRLLAPVWQGRAFAAVAAEVKELAAPRARANQRIAEQARAIQGELRRDAHDRRDQQCGRPVRDAQPTIAAAIEEHPVVIGATAVGVHGTADDASRIDEGAAGVLAAARAAIEASQGAERQLDSVGDRRRALAIGGVAQRPGIDGTAPAG